jgi:alkylhydroperoxidase family enzyme
MPDDGPRLSTLSDAELTARGLPLTSGDLVRVFGHAPDAFARWNDWYRAIIADGAVDSRLKEIVRLRVAQLNDCEF